MEDNLLKKTTILSTLFTVTAVGIMALFFVYRDIPVNAEGMGADAQTVMGENVEMLDTEAGVKTTDYLCIPLPETVAESQVTMTINHMTHTFSLSIAGVEEDFYYRHSFSGCSDHIANLMYGYGNETARIDLILDSVYEYDSVFENGNLYLKFITPKEQYHRVVVLDPGHGGNSVGTTSYGQTERDIVLEVAMRVEQLLEDSDIKAYCTRTTNDEEPDNEARLQLAAETKADMMICVHANADAKTRVTNGVQIIYSDEVFIPKFGSVDLAQVLEAEMMASTGAKSQGCVSGNEIEILANATIPTVYAEVGYLTNRQESLKLGTDEYLDQVALGIYNGIMKSYEEMEKEQ